MIERYINQVSVVCVSVDYDGIFCLRVDEIMVCNVCVCLCVVVCCTSGYYASQTRSVYTHVYVYAVHKC